MSGLFIGLALQVTEHERGSIFVRKLIQLFIQERHEIVAGVFGGRIGS